MKTAILSALLFMLPQAPGTIPKNDPNGVWQSESGSAYKFQLNGSDLKVQIVDGSNPKYIKYEVNLKVDPKETNTYRGAGSYVAKMNTGKECKFDTDWEILVVSPEQIFGQTTLVNADSATCEVKSKEKGMLDLKKKK